MNELRSILGDVVTRLFTDLVTKELLESAERGEWPAALWQAVEENGLTLPLVAESKGGAGGTWGGGWPSGGEAGAGGGGGSTTRPSDVVVVTPIELVKTSKTLVISARPVDSLIL